MTHVHTIAAVRRTGKAPQGWDYDLIGVSAYLMASTFDLILKARTIANLGIDASASPLLPALVCAERVVLLGSGSPVFSIAMTLIFGGSSRLRTAFIAGAPLILAFVASGFTWGAHRAIAQTAPIPWCSFHNNDTDLSLMSVDTPAEMGKMVWDMFLLLKVCWIAIAFFAIVTILDSALRDPPRSMRSLMDALGNLVLTTVFLPLLFLALAGFVLVILWPCLELLILWWLVYIFAFFPQRGYFPITGMSALDMDQAAALSAIIVVAAIRSWRPILRAACSRFAPSAAASNEHSPLLPVSVDGTTGD